MHIMRETDVVKATGLSKSTIRRRELAGSFPQRRKISDRATGWLDTDINTWLKELPFGGCDEPAAASEKSLTVRTKHRPHP